MMGIFRIIQGIVKLRGATDGTAIGNVGDKLKTTAELSITSVTPQVNKTLRYDDMNASTGGIARGTGVSGTLTQVYSYTGSGLLAGFLVTLETMITGWEITLTLDGVNVINAVNSDDLSGAVLYGYDSAIKGGGNGFLGFDLSGNSIRWNPPNSNFMPYSTSVKVYLKRSAGAPSKKFNAGLVSLTKET